MSKESKIFYQRRLPHYQPEDSTFFITCRLSESLPISVIARLKEEREIQKTEIAQEKDQQKRNQLIANYQQIYFGKFDEFLDTAPTGHRWFVDDRVAQIVADALHFRDQIIFGLICFSIMPNHLHFVIDTEPTLLSKSIDDSTYVKRDGIPLYNMLHSFKRFTAIECNHALNRTGSFYQAESYNRVFRDDELEQIISYTLYNPVKAGLCQHWQDWKWSYITKDYRQGFE